MNKLIIDDLRKIKFEVLKQISPKLHKKILNFCSELPKDEYPEATLILKGKSKTLYGMWKIQHKLEKRKEKKARKYLKNMKSMILMATSLHQGGEQKNKRGHRGQKKKTGKGFFKKVFGSKEKPNLAEASMQEDKIEELITKIKKLEKSAHKKESRGSGAAAEYYERAADAAQEVARLSGKDPYSEQASALYTKAVENYKKSVKRNDNPNNNHGLAKCLEAIGKYNEAAQAYARAAELYRYNRDSVLNIFGTYTNHMAACYDGAGRSYSKAEKYYEAARIYEEAGGAFHNGNVRAFEFYTKAIKAFTEGDMFGNASAVLKGMGVKISVPSTSKRIGKIKAEMVGFFLALAKKKERFKSATYEMAAEFETDNEKKVDFLLEAARISKESGFKDLQKSVDRMPFYNSARIYRKAAETETNGKKKAQYFTLSADTFILNGEFLEAKRDYENAMNAHIPDKKTIAKLHKKILTCSVLSGAWKNVEDELKESYPVVLEYLKKDQTIYNPLFSIKTYIDMKHIEKAIAMIEKAYEEFGAESSQKRIISSGMTRWALNGFESPKGIPSFFMFHALAYAQTPEQLDSMQRLSNLDKFSSVSNRKLILDMLSKVMAMSEVYVNNQAYKPILFDKICKVIDVSRDEEVFSNIKMLGILGSVRNVANLEFSNSSDFQDTVNKRIMEIASGITDDKAVRARFAERIGELYDNGFLEALTDAYSVSVYAGRDPVIHKLYDAILMAEIMDDSERLRVPVVREGGESIERISSITYLKPSYIEVLSDEIDRLKTFARNTRKIMEGKGIFTEE
jgi:tetratricopeptide (TPR) repeat protein